MAPRYYYAEAHSVSSDLKYLYIMVVQSEAENGSGYWRIGENSREYKSCGDLTSWISETADVVQELTRDQASRLLTFWGYDPL